jgi:hypothetical protein
MERTDNALASLRARKELFFVRTFFEIIYKVKMYFKKKTQVYYVSNK